MLENRLQGWSWAFDCHCQVLFSDAGEVSLTGDGIVALSQRSSGWLWLSFTVLHGN